MNARCQMEQADWKWRRWVSDETYIYARLEAEGSLAETAETPHRTKASPYIQ